MVQGSKAGDFRPPRVGKAQIGLLERLCNANAVSGDEGEVRKIVLEQVEGHVSAQKLQDRVNVRVDSLGNVLVTRRGTGESRVRVMLAAHMDEVGLMLTQDEENGVFRFELVGGVEERYLIGKPVFVGGERVPGVIGIKPIHLTTPEELKRRATVEALRIDVGPGNSGKVKAGDRAAFATAFAQVGPSIRAKALDDRLGVASLIELFKHAPESIDLLAAFTVQEEIGLRGAQVAAYALDPQMAIILECGPARDLPPWDTGEEGSQVNAWYNTRLGAGPAIYVADRGTLSDPRLVRHLTDIAEKQGIPYQFRQPGGGRTDASVIHKQRAGIPSISVAVPGRYAHTPVGLARLADWKNLLALVYGGLYWLTPEILSAGR